MFRQTAHSIIQFPLQNTPQLHLPSSHPHSSTLRLRCREIIKFKTLSIPRRTLANSIHTHMMGDHRTIDVENLMSLSNDLVNVLKKNKDISTLMQSLEGAKILHSSCESDFNETRNSLKEYEKKIATCRQRIDEIKHEVVTDACLDGLQNELEEEIRKERLLTEELRVVDNQISELEYQRIAVEEKKQILNKSEKDELRAQRLLSLYASVTNIIPNLDDPTNISGYIVDRDRKIAEKFEFTPANSSSLEICNDLWKMINL